LCNGFKGLHEVGVMHRDFKPANVFMKDGKLKIGDLGFAK
jgi:serine/threonine protein kinase